MCSIYRVGIRIKKDLLPPFTRHITRAAAHHVPFQPSLGAKGI